MYTMYFDYTYHQFSHPTLSRCPPQLPPKLILSFFLFFNTPSPISTPCMCLVTAAPQQKPRTNKKNYRDLWEASRHHCYQNLNFYEENWKKDTLPVLTRTSVAQGKV